MRRTSSHALAAINDQWLGYDTKEPRALFGDNDFQAVSLNPWLTLVSYDVRHEVICDLLDRFEFKCDSDTAKHPQRPSRFTASTD